MHSRAIQRGSKLSRPTHAWVGLSCAVLRLYARACDGCCLSVQSPLWRNSCRLGSTSANRQPSIASRTRAWPVRHSTAWRAVDWRLVAQDLVYARCPTAPVRPLQSKAPRKPPMPRPIPENCSTTGVCPVLSRALWGSRLLPSRYTCSAFSESWPNSAQSWQSSLQIGRSRARFGRARPKADMSKVFSSGLYSSYVMSVTPSKQGRRRTMG